MGTGRLTGPFNVRPTKAAMAVGTRPIACSARAFCASSRPDVRLSAGANLLSPATARGTLAHVSQFCVRIVGVRQRCCETRGSCDGSCSSVFSVARFASSSRARSSSSRLRAISASMICNHSDRAIRVAALACSRSACSGYRGRPLLRRACSKPDHACRCRPDASVRDPPSCPAHRARRHRAPAVACRK